MTPANPLRSGVALLAVLTLLLDPAVPLVAAAMAAGQATPKPAPAAAGATVAVETAVDGGWPRVYDLPSGGTILMYQPQIATWDKQTHMVAYSAVSLRATGAEKPVLGSIKLEADTKVALDERLVNFQNLKIAEANFKELAKERVAEVVAQITKAFPNEERVIALDRILVNVDKSNIVPKTVVGIKADPPTIFFSKTAGGDRQRGRGADLEPDQGERSQVRRQHQLGPVPARADVHLLPAARHQLAEDADLAKGPWAPAGALPASFAKLPAEENWKDVKANLPGKALAAGAVPKVFVSNTPAELLLLAGEPRYAAVTGTGLLWVSNTESDVFRLGKTGPVYYIVAGRWFSAPDFGGPWTFATPSLPADFKKIPLEHERSRVLASVPGTDQAAEAVLLAQIPQTARVNKKELKAPEVAYQDEPKFAPIASTTVQRAVNTDKDVFKVGDAYYMCNQGVWFTGTSPTGPWTVANSVPQEIYQIPASDPSHHVTYVTVEDDDDDDEWVTFAAAAGYTGMMMAWGCAVWGSGLVLPAVLRLRRLLPVLLRALSDLRLFRLVQPADGRLRTQRRRLRTVRRRRRRRALQPAHRHLRARRRGVWTVRRSRRGQRLQSAHRRLRDDASGIERLRQLGIDRRAARRRLGQDQPLHEQPDRQHHAHDQDRRGRRGDEAGRQRRPGRGRRRRQRLRGQGRERLPPRGRHLAEARERRLVGHRPPAERRQADASERSRPAIGPARWIAAPTISSTAIRLRAARAPSAPVTTAPIRAAAGRAAAAAATAAAAAAMAVAEAAAAAAVAVAAAAVAAGAAEDTCDRSFRASGLSTSPDAVSGLVDISRARVGAARRAKSHS